MGVDRMKRTLHLDDDTCGVIHERLEQAVEDLTRWLSGGGDALPPSTLTLLRTTLEEVTDAYDDFMAAWSESEAA